jgi:hypothetical protein
MSTTSATVSMMSTPIDRSSSPVSVRAVRPSRVS